MGMMPGKAYSKQLSKKAAVSEATKSIRDLNSLAVASAHEHKCPGSDREAA